MKITKVPIEWKETYIAFDDTIWGSEKLCLEYEELKKDITPLRSLIFFNEDGNTIDIFSKKDIPAFCYLYIPQDIKKYNEQVITMIIKGTQNPNKSFCLPNEKGFYFNDWSNAYNGAYGYNGWCKQENIETCHLKIKKYEKQIQLFQKILDK